MAKLKVYSILFLILFFVSCSSDPDEVDITVTLDNLSVTIEENPTNGQVIGTINSSTNDGAITFSITSESPAGALSVDATSGQVTVLDASLFDFEVNPTITATITGSNQDVSDESIVTVTLTDVNEAAFSVENFSLTIDERPDDGSVLGTLSTSNAGSSTSFSIAEESREGAFRINTASGELSVLTGAFFDFEINATVTATISATSDGTTDEATVTITLNDVEEPVVIYSGDMITFSKGSFADQTQAENQDRITETTWITRADTRGLFNIRLEELHDMGGDSPINTEWAQGTTADLDNLQFEDWTTAVNSNPPGAVGVDYVMHIISDNIFIDIRVLSWGGRGAGGDFSYQRSTPAQ